MSDIAIRVENLSKRYRIGQRERYKALRDVITDAVASPLRRLWHREPENRRTGEPGHPPVSPMPRFADSQEDGYIRVLKEVSFEMKQGEVIGITCQINEEWKTGHRKCTIP